MGIEDIFRFTDQLNDEALELIVCRLESRGADPFYRGIIEDYLAAMDVDSAGNVLDIGCGTGVVARAIALRSSFRGTVVGVDLSPDLLDIAKRLATEESVSDRIEFVSGDSLNLEFPDGAFDTVVAHTLFSHLTDPVPALIELTRVLRPGGLIAIFDGDCASLTLSMSDPELGSIYEQKIIDGLFAGPYVMRQMPRLAQEAGLEIVSTLSYVNTEAGSADFWTPAIESFGRLSVQAGTMTADEAEFWTAELREASEKGVFFGSCNYHTYLLSRPG